MIPSSNPPHDDMGEHIPAGSSESPNLSVLLFQWLCWEQKPRHKCPARFTTQQNLFSCSIKLCFKHSIPLGMLHAAGRAPLPGAQVKYSINVPACLDFSLTQSQHKPRPEHQHSSKLS